MKTIHEQLTYYKDLVYNAHASLREYYTYEELNNMPIRYLIAEVEYITPKLQEIARRQEQDRLRAEMTGKNPVRMPGQRGR